MIGQWRWVLAGLIALATALPALAGEPGGAIEHLPPIASRYADSPKLSIWTPPGYDPAGNARYGVVYMLDGQNLFDPALAGYGKVWRADTTAARLIAEHRIDPVIIVGLWSEGASRYRAYLPKTLYTAARGDLRAEMDRLAGGPVVSDQFLRYLTRDLKPWIDAQYRTRPDKADTTIIGSSMGGLIALEAIATYPKIFGRAGCVSTHWPLGDPSKVSPESPAIIALWDPYLRRTLGKPAGRRLWFDTGTATLDAHYPPYLARTAATLTANGWTEGTDFRAETYRGAEHDENYWAARLPDILIWLGGKPE